MRKTMATAHSGEGFRRPGRLPGELVRVLESDIIYRGHELGPRLVEEEIASRYDISRSPVREAFRELEHNGLIVRGAKGGMHVPPLSLEDLAEGGPRAIEFLDRSTGRTKNLEVQIPGGVLPGQSIRLGGQGGKGMGAPDGDLLLKVEDLPHSVFRRRGRDLHCDVPVAPWTAALGGKVRIPTLGGYAEATLPPGSSTGRKMRLRGRGLPNPKGPDGDLLAEIQVVVPKQLTAEEQTLFEQLREASGFEPSGEAPRAAESDR